MNPKKARFRGGGGEFEGTSAPSPLVHETRIPTPLRAWSQSIWGGLRDGETAWFLTYVRVITYVQTCTTSGVACGFAHLSVAAAWPAVTLSFGHIPHAHDFRGLILVVFIHCNFLHERYGKFGSYNYHVRIEAQLVSLKSYLNMSVSNQTLIPYPINGGI